MPTWYRGSINPCSVERYKRRGRSMYLRPPGITQLCSLPGQCKHGLLQCGEPGIGKLGMKLYRANQELNVGVLAFRSEVVKIRKQFAHSIGIHGCSLQGK